MLTDGRTTDAGVTGKLIAHLRAFGSCELITERMTTVVMEEKKVKFFLPSLYLLKSIH